MKHENIVKVYYTDTDSYGIVWHGAYIKWFEVGRVEFSGLCDIDFGELQSQDILMPVVELHCRYKHTAKVLDELRIVTELKELTKTAITFSHVITNVKTDELILNAYSTVVTTNQAGKLYRKIPEYLYNKMLKAIENNK